MVDRSPTAPARVGLVVHPRRDVDDALAATRDWASRHGVSLGQVLITGQTRRVADPIDVESCDLLLALGGDGTALAALHAGAPGSRPVLGVACGSIGVLTSVPAESVGAALDQVSAGNWTPRLLPALEIAAGAAEVRFAINDFAVIRAGTGQLITEISVDGETYARTAGDGLVVATPLGSTAYTMAAGGPILMPPALGIVVTPVAQHGGVTPSLVVEPDSRVGVSIEPGHGGSRFEVDGKELAVTAHEVSAGLRREYAMLVTLADEEPLLTGLRRRGLVVDSPRILARQARATSSADWHSARSQPEGSP
jgi:NAD+ kinase